MNILEHTKIIKQIRSTQKIAKTIFFYFLGIFSFENVCEQTVIILHMTLILFKITYHDLFAMKYYPNAQSCQPSFIQPFTYWCRFKLFQFWLYLKNILINICIFLLENFYQLIIPTIYHSALSLHFCSCQYYCWVCVCVCIFKFIYKF